MDDQPQDYKTAKDTVKSEQSGKSYDEIRNDMKEKSEHVVELDRMSPVIHRWIDRGAVMSCEGADHPNHRAFKR